MFTRGHAMHNENNNNNNNNDNNNNNNIITLIPRKFHVNMIDAKLQIRGAFLTIIIKIIITIKDFACFQNLFSDNLASNKLSAHAKFNAQRHLLTGELGP